MTKHIDKKIILSVIILILILTFVFPYTHDDWSWGSHFGIDRLNNFFKDYNGRYISNILVIILTRSNILKTICMTSIIFGIIYLSYKLVNPTKSILFYLSLFLFLLLPRNIFRQGLAWTSGFVNYTFSTFLIILYLYLNRKVIFEYIEKKSIKTMFFFFILGIISSLFLENVTIFNILISLGLLIYIYYKHKNWSLNNLSYFIGSIIGGVIMFTNGAYYNIANASDPYRNVPENVDSLWQTITQNIKTITNYLVFENVLLIVILTILLLILYSKNVIKNKMLNLSSLMITAFATYLTIKSLNPTWKILLKYTTIFEHVLIVIYLISAFMIIYFSIKDKTKLFKIVFYLIASVVLVASLLVVNPVGPRNLFGNYIFIVLIVLEIFNHMYQNNDSLRKFLIVGAGVIYVYYLSIYAYIYKLNNEIVNFVIEESQTKNVVEIPEIPNGNLYTQHINFNEIFAERYKYFYNINQEVEFIILPYNKWHEKYRQ